MRINNIFMVIYWVSLTMSGSLIAGGDGDKGPQVASPGRLRQFLQTSLFRNSLPINHSSDSDQSSVNSSSASISLSSPQISSTSIEVKDIASFGSSQKIMSALARYMARRKSSRSHSVATSGDSHGEVISSSSSSGSPFTSAVNFNQKADSPDEILDNVKEGIACVMGAARDVFEHDGYASYDDTNGSNEVDGIMSVLDHVRDMLNSYRMRADPDFVTSYEETLRHNFASVGNFDPKNVYSYLSRQGYPDLNDSAEMAISQYSSEKMMALIAKLKIDAMNAQDTKEVSLLRQMEYPFRNSATQQVFNAYIRGGKEAISVLQVTSQETVGRYEYLTNVTMQLKEDLRESCKRRSLNKVSASHDVTNDGRSDLADQAFALEAKI
jgi:hypothetical protein